MNRCLAVFALLTVFFTLNHEVIGRAPLRIINGTDASEGEFPYMVQLRLKHGSFFCGGSIIGPEWILTAAHCVGLVGNWIDSIVYGTNKLYNTNDGYPNTSITVKNWFKYPNFTLHIDGPPTSDLGILQLSEPIPYSDNAQPIKLAEADEEVPFHVDGILGGWGVYNRSAFVAAPYLQKINFQLLNDEECAEKINPYFDHDIYQSDIYICNDVDFNGACFGDSGSPFVINGTQYGLVAWMYPPCGTSPDVYTRITNPLFRNWIKEITNI